MSEEPTESQTTDEDAEGNPTPSEARTGVPSNKRSVEDQAKRRTEPSGAHTIKGNPVHTVKPDLRVEEVVHGSHPGDQFIRYRRQRGAFRRAGRNILEASLEAEAPRTSWGRIFNAVKRVLIGKPISS